MPSGDAKLGDQQFIVKVNATAQSIEALNRIPIKKVGGATVFLSDVAHVRDGWAVQQNIVRAEGKRSVLLTIIKNGNASTLDVVNRVKAALPEIQKAAPPGMDIKLLFDQSVFVQNAIDSVLSEGAIAAGLTALMILIFLGSWRSTIVVMVSIPLSILTSIAVLSALGQTINTMTLGGLALAVGILVDDSTVTIENTHRLLEEGIDFDRAVLEGAAGIAVPTLISTLAICCVFVSVFFLQGAARYLFTPLAMAVVFAMLASYCISRTLTPIMIGLLIRKEHESHGEPSGWLARFHAGFNARFDRFRDFYGWLLAGILRRKILMPTVALLVIIGGGALALNRRLQLLPGRRRRPHSAACQSAGAHAHRAHRADFPGDRGQDPDHHFARGSEARARQYRAAATPLQSRLHRRQRDRRQRRGHPDGAERGSSADRGHHQEAAPRTRPRLSGRYVLFSAR